MRALTSLLLPEIEELARKGDAAAIRTAVEELHPADIADFVQHLDVADGGRLIGALEVRPAADVFEHLEPERQVALIDALGRPRLVPILDQKSPDDRADLARRLPPATVEALLPLLAQAERNDVRRLLSYPEGTAGALLTTEYASLGAELTVEQALAELRKIAPDPETIYYVYVTDAERRLRGVVTLREIVVAPPRKTLGDLMRENPVSVRVDEDQEAVARVFENYDLVAVPVVNGDGRLVGIVTVDDALDVIERSATQTVQRLGGTAPLETAYFTAGFAELVRKRAVWLVLLFAAELLTATVLANHQAAIESAIALVFFLPLITSSGGNAGSQSATLVTRALALGDVRPSDVVKVLLREASMGLALGGVLAGVGIARVFLGGHGAYIAFAVGLTLLCVVSIGTIVGAFLPILLRRLGFDPAVSSSPFIASLVDVLGCLTYFAIASAVVGI